MSEDIKELKGIASRLNKASNALNESLSQINAKLNEMNIGLTVWLGAPPLLIRSIDLRTEEKDLLGYAKTSKGWGLSVKTVTEQHGFFQGDEDMPYTNLAEGEARPLLESSRDLRVEAINLIPQLIERIKENAVNALEGIELAKKLASEL